MISVICHSLSRQTSHFSHAEDTPGDTAEGVKVYASRLVRQFETPPPTLVDQAGRVRFGTFSGPIPALNLLDAKPWPLPMPRALRAFRLKEWQAIQLGNRRYFVLVALFNAKVLALAQVKIYDRERRQKYIFERKLPGWAFDAPDNLLDSRMRWSADGATIAFHNELAEGRLTLELELPASADMPALRGTIVADARGCDPQVVSIPFADNRGMYSHKGCMVPSGALRLGEDSLDFGSEDAFLMIDDHKGYYAWVMRWDWVTGGGLDAHGRRVSFNLTRNASIDPARYNENCLWIDGRAHLLPPVEFTRRPELEPEVWEVRDLAGTGEVAVDFVIEVDGYVRVNALVIESRYRGPFGSVRGTIRSPEGEAIALDGMFGMGEDFYLRC
ncbi:DUF2804 domain-containing protein [Pseudenhygromyxa sp. WMMC2535]|uniref:DUF2804 domain-containing protein n=1 Tax=Pseudenhygromyxa sp. WMMC2535 TaxID=2712867 RepID=UPI001595CF3F|nr:DUF2804 domain-containing protein [Pseudenhygromyxa sp. WMMC2535]NVB39058.1 DUF2804 domain-containing protein [Pseudenhygromyxa sp. WMMC2535]